MAVISALGLSCFIAASAAPVQASPEPASAVHAAVPVLSEMTSATAPAAGGETFLNMGTGLCLESTSRTGPAAVYTNICDGGPFQRWSSWNDGHNNYHFVNDATQLCLDSDARGFAYALGCNTDGFQNWSFWSSGHNDFHYLDNKTQRCLTDSWDRFEVFTEGCRETDFQRWRH
jgi:hypothetical protein